LELGRSPLFPPSTRRTTLCRQPPERETGNGNERDLKGRPGTVPGERLKALSLEGGTSTQVHERKKGGKKATPPSHSPSNWRTELCRQPPVRETRTGAERDLKGRPGTVPLERLKALSLEGGTATQVHEEEKASSHFTKLEDRTLPSATGERNQDRRRA
jgi:hypothetical protein